MARLTDTETDVKLSVPVSQKISIGIMMLGALSALFGIALGLYEMPKEKIGGNNDPHLSIKSVTAASVVTSYDYNSISFGGKLGNGTITFGTLGQELMYPYSTFQPGTAATQNYSLFVKVKGEKHGDVYTYDDMLLKISTDQGVKNICLSAKEDTASELIYYVDGNGNTYQDFTLKTRANVSACSDLIQSISKAYKIGEIGGAVIEYLAPNDQKDKLMGPTIDFYRDHFQLARLIAHNNVFSPGEALGPAIAEALKTPLTLKLSQYWIEPGVFPARRVLLNRDLNNVGYNSTPTSVICIPEITVPAGWPDYKVKKLYYDTTGNAYYDLFLTQRVTTETCDQTFTEQLLPKDVVDASISSLVPNASEDVMVFRRGTGILGWLGVKNNVYTNIPQTPELGKTLHLENFSSNFPARTFKIRTDDGASYTLCFPDKPSYTSLFYGTDGNPYRDETLFFGGVVSGCDKSAPVAYMVSPSAGGQKLGAGGYTFVAKAKDNVVIDKTKFFIDGTEYAANTKAGQPVDYYFSESINLTSGNHAVYFQATDPSGNIGKSISLSFIVGAYQCQDGTLAGSCNGNSQYCDPDTLNLVNKCIYCGYQCPSSTPICDPLIGTCKINTCSDGTQAGKCNGAKQYCNSLTLTLTNNCNYCGYTCPAATPNCDASTGMCKPTKVTNTNTAVPVE